MGQSEPDFRRSFSAQIGPARVETLRVYPKSTGLSEVRCAPTRISRSGHARDIALEFVLSMTPPSQGWSSRWRRRDDHAVRCISVIDAVTAVALWTSDACAAAAIRSTSVRSRRSIHHVASVT